MPVAAVCHALRRPAIATAFVAYVYYSALYWLDVHHIGASKYTLYSAAKPFAVLLALLLAETLYAVLPCRALRSPLLQQGKAGEEAAEIELVSLASGSQRSASRRQQAAGRLRKLALSFQRPLKLKAIAAVAFLACAGVVVTVLLSVRPLLYSAEAYSGFGIGAVSDSKVAVRLRSPLHVRARLQLRRGGVWEESGDAAAASRIDSSADHTATLRCSQLRANTEHTLRIVLTDSSGDEEAWRPFAVRTAGARNDSTPFTFTFGSCLKQSWGDFSELRLLQARAPSFVLFIGDLIYSDYPVDLGEAARLFYAHYRRLLSFAAVSDFFASLPTFFMYDDHEIEDDWARGWRADRYAHGIAAWQAYAGRSNPPPMAQDSHHYAFHWGANAAFFVCDTRKWRQPGVTMLGQAQLDDLRAWLASNTTAAAAWKFIVTTVPFATAVQSADDWAAFGEERAAILQAIAAANVSGVVFLSGDKHYAAVYDIAPGIVEFSVSPMAAFASQSRPADDGSVRFWAASDAFQSLLTVSQQTLRFELFDAAQAGAPRVWQTELSRQ